MEFIVAAFVIGIMGSLHCMGMCGPIALMLHARIPGNPWFHSTLYNLGRIVMYAILGGVVSLLGRGIALAGLQQALSIGTGTLILLVLVVQAGGKKLTLIGKWNDYFGGRVRQAMQKILPHNSLTGFFAAGLVNGLLPCGLVYIALAGALNTPTVGTGTMFMVAFGLGTFPAMFVAGISTKYFGAGRRAGIRKLLPWFTALVAVLLIVRGLDLGIPYMSPHMDAHGQVMDCCKQPVVH
jgi:sulfite exporter TauE/SafE